MKKLYSITIAAGLALALAGCAGNNASTPSGDRDGDGIANISDQCPNTVLGTKVSKDGCKIYPTILELNEKELCSVDKNGIESVIATAAKYNKTAKAHGVEFKRLGMTNTQYIDGVNKALKTGGKMVVLLNKKGKPDKKLKPVTVKYAAERACKFAISALAQEAEGKTNWRLAVPGDGYKY